jgi:hypothetical protein
MQSLAWNPVLVAELHQRQTAVVELRLLLARSASDRLLA